MIKTKKVLSFDVGIINLAYCILEINDNEKRFKINEWGVINLADNRQTCNFIKRSGDICEKIAKNVVKIDTYNKYYYCSSHISKAELKIAPVNIHWWNIPLDEIGKCTFCKKSSELYSNLLPGQYCRSHQKKALTDKGLLCMAKKCHNEIKYGLYLVKPEHSDNDSVCDDMAYRFEHGWCDEHYDVEYREFIKKKTKKLPQNSNKISLNKLCEFMYKKMDMMPELLQVDEVLIENQPTHINPTMKSISIMIFSYFQMRGLVEKSKTGSTIRDIKLCTPGRKITVGGEIASQRLKNAKDNKIYKTTKELGLRFCKALISDNENWLKLIESHKKQDDMADAFLQAFILYFGQDIPEYYANKIRAVDTNIHQKNNIDILGRDDDGGTNVLEDNNNYDKISIKIGKNIAKSDTVNTIDTIDDSKTKTMNKKKKYYSNNYKEPKEKKEIINKNDIVRITKSKTK